MMAGSGKDKERLDVTPEEMKQFENAMKNEEFKKLFVEYAMELADPKNKKQYEEDILRMEAERGRSVLFVVPKPSFVVKTSYVGGGKKVFINMCQSDKIGKSESRSGEYCDLQGQHWQIPFSFTFVRDELDNSGKKVDVFDAIFHPETCERGLKDFRFRKLMLDSAMDGIEKKNKIHFDRKRIRFPKMKFKGTPKPILVRKEITEDHGVEMSHQNTTKCEHDKQPVKNGSLNENDTQPVKGQTLDKKDTESGKCQVQSDTQSVKGKDKDEGDSLAAKKAEYSNTDSSETAVGMEVPYYTMVHRGFVDLQDYTLARDAAPDTRPRELIVTVELPRCKSAASVRLDVFEKKIILESKRQRYSLDLLLPYPVDESKGEAMFDKSKRRLTITLSVLPAKVPDKQIQTVFAGSCPHYTFQQDEETATFILHVSNVIIDSITKDIMPDKVELKFQSHSEHDCNECTCYSFCVRFPSEHQIIVEKTNVEVLCETLIILVWKDSQCQRTWQSFHAGSAADCLEERKFLTVESVADAVKEIENPANDPWGSDGCESFTCAVSDMTDDCLVVQLDKSIETEAETIADTSRERQIEKNMTTSVLPMEEPVSAEFDKDKKVLVHQTVSHCWPRLEEECKTHRDDSQVDSEDKRTTVLAETMNKIHCSADEQVDVHTECKQSAEVIEEERTLTSKQDNKLLSEEDNKADSSSDSCSHTHVQLSSLMMYDLD